MNLEEKLKLYPDLFKLLEEIVISCGKIWSNTLLPWFTNHDVYHSKEIIHLLGQILSPIENTPQCLNEHEIFILLSSAYLHDIGMQNLKVDNISIDKLTSDEYEYIRKRHAEESHDIILKRLKKPLDRDDFYLPLIEDDYLQVIAKVSKGHATDFFKEIINYFQKNPAKPLNRPVRGELLTALLMIADELDLHNKRARFIETAKFNLSDFSAVHWYKHHYMDGVEINNGIVNLILTFPPDVDDYKDLVKEIIETKLKKQIEKVNTIFSNSTAGLLHIHNINIQTRLDNTKRRLPDGALKELKKILNKDTSIISSAAEKKDIIRRSIPKSTKIFTGRKDELNRFKEAFEQSSLISIEGLGGIGKTEFAAKCIEEYLQEYKVIWFDCYPDSKLDTLIGYCGYSDVLKGEEKTERAKYSGFTDLIERDKIIIFLDNFQDLDVMDDSFRNFFIFSERRLREAKIVLIAREHPSLGCVRVSPVTLEGLKEDSVEYAKKVVSTYYPDVTINDEDLANVCEAVAGHPLAIDLAIQLLHYGETPNNILEKFILYKDEVEKLTHRLLDEIFEHPKSTKEEKEFLVNFSIFRTKVNQNAFDYISDTPDRMVILRKLIDKQMIIRHGNLYGSHPLVREFCYHHLEDKKGLHFKAYEYLKTYRKVKLEPLLEEEIFYHLLKGERFQELADIISEKGEDFILIGHTNSLKAMMDKAMEMGIKRAVFYLYYGDITQIQGEWNKALNYFEQSFSFPGVGEKTSAMAYIKYGEMLYRKGEVKESLKFFEDGYDKCKKIKYKEVEARSINNLGNVLRKQGDLKGALEKYKESLKIVEEIGDKSGIATSLNNIGGILDTQGDLKGALEKYKESLKIVEEIGDKSGIATSLNNIGFILGKQGDLKGALEKYRESLRIKEEIGDKSGIATSLNNIGGILDKQGDLKGALEKYKESLRIKEEIGNKSGIATSLNNIGGILDKQGDLKGALEKYKESLKIVEEIGDKSGIARSLNNIGFILDTQGDLKGALEKYRESLKIVEEIGDKSGIATSLNNIGGILHKQGDVKGALEKYKESLRIEEEIGDNSGIARSFHNIGTLYTDDKNYRLALVNLFKSKALQNQIGIKEQATINYIFKIRNAQGLKNFKILAREVFHSLPEDLKPSINLEEFFEDKTVHTDKEVGRNAPCPCGSGKKYKRCCGHS
ncbi:MAG: tetratricopeptide repeat protein [Planctomycetes bacterium]|nr:tetratricopeptide repeat protein [Planctomycetota bacterium]